MRVRQDVIRQGSGRVPDDGFAFTLNDVTDDAGILALADQVGKGPVGIACSHAHHHTDATVEGAVHLGSFNIAVLL